VARLERRRDRGPPCYIKADAGRIITKPKSQLLERLDDFRRERPHRDLALTGKQLPRYPQIPLRISTRHDDKAFHHVTIGIFAETQGKNQVLGLNVMYRNPIPFSPVGITRRDNLVR
jgi:hypothetical protein